MSDQPSFKCPQCGAVSYNPNNIREGYCGCCHDWTGTPNYGFGLPEERAGIILDHESGDVKGAATLASFDFNDAREVPPPSER